MNLAAEIDRLTSALKEMTKERDTYQSMTKVHRQQWLEAHDSAETAEAALAEAVARARSEEREACVEAIRIVANDWQDEGFNEQKVAACDYLIMHIRALRPPPASQPKQVRPTNCPHAPHHGGCHFPDCPKDCAGRLPASQTGEG